MRGFPLGRGVGAVTWPRLLADEGERTDSVSTGPRGYVEQHFKFN